MEAIKNEPRLEGKIPENFTDRDFIKFNQAYKFDIKKTVNALVAHFNWRFSYLPCKLTENAIRLIVSFQNFYIS